MKEIKKYDTKYSRSDVMQLLRGFYRESCHIKGVRLMDLDQFIADNLSGEEWKKIKKIKNP